MKYFAKINYLGTSFHGFQVQPGLRTVQGELCLALSQAFGTPCKVTGCSRTDAGVHANEFCVTIEADDATIPPSKLPIAVSRFLPVDISLYEACACEDGFHPRYNVKYKEYVYRIINSRIYDPFEYGRAWFFPREINERAIALMNEAAEFIKGTHDFAAFMAEGTDVTDTARTVFDLYVKKTGELITVTVSADGFLYNMVRIIVGTLIDVAFEKILPKDVCDIIISRKRALAGMTAPPEGLYLNRVVY